MGLVVDTLEPIEHPVMLREPLAMEDDVQQDSAEGSNGALDKCFALVLLTVPHARYLGRGKAPARIWDKSPVYGELQECARALPGWTMKGEIKDARPDYRRCGFHRHVAGP